MLSTIAWLNESGLSTADTWQKVYDIGVVEIQLHAVPPTLAYLSQVEDALSISRITKHGVVFYLTDVALTSGPPDRHVPSDRQDGFLFVPMSNIICINTFGSVYPRGGAA
ncbi:hypothetical protein [Lysobacter sp. CFH 32150]|uniref:hypothetical protein n=1 Tax=Lysobacter sp. CFH 32150 TaxID=2927128 RepID=UPI001FA6EADE|nr:hypothetical protein [Lysobacter sp. CFH 32150]MCI4569474.1 hypothetical protein [Lysobacter sp. CFH 32150]